MEVVLVVVVVVVVAVVGSVAVAVVVVSVSTPEDAWTACQSRHRERGCDSFVWAVRVSEDISALKRL